MRLSKAIMVAGIRHDSTIQAVRTRHFLDSVICCSWGVVRLTSSILLRNMYHARRDVRDFAQASYKHGGY